MHRVDYAKSTTPVAALFISFLLGCSEADPPPDAAVSCSPIETSDAPPTCPRGCVPFTGVTVAADVECLPANWNHGSGEVVEAAPIGCLPIERGAYIELPAHTCLMNTANGVRTLFTSYPADLALTSTVRPCTPVESTICE